MHRYRWENLMNNLVGKLTKNESLLMKLAFLKKTLRLGGFYDTISFTLEMAYTIVRGVKAGKRLAFVTPDNEIEYVESHTLANM